MDCPYCRKHAHFHWDDKHLTWHGYNTGIYTRSAQCPACQKFILQVDAKADNDYRFVVPVSSARKPVSAVVPGEITLDYVEAVAVLPISAKASAALSRRCLQNILTSQGYLGRDLMKQVSAFVGEPDPAKVAPASLRQTVDAVRNFGNFSAHPIDDKTSLQIIDVEPHEAEWCLEIIEDMFEHFYVRPAEAAARKAALNAKLGAAGKPAAQ